MKMGANGLELLKEFEGFRANAYPDPATGGEPWTIGYGHTSMAGEPKVSKGMKITKEEAEHILARDLAKYEEAVNKYTTHKPNQNQFDAMVSFCYNVGPANFKTSSVTRHFNAREYDKAAHSFLLWNKAAGKVMTGLTRRREAEKKLFSTPVSKHLETANG